MRSAGSPGSGGPDRSPQAPAPRHRGQKLACACVCVYACFTVIGAGQEDKATGQKASPHGTCARVGTEPPVRNLGEQSTAGYREGQMEAGGRGGGGGGWRGGRGPEAKSHSWDVRLHNPERGWQMQTRGKPGNELRGPCKEQVIRNT